MTSLFRRYSTQAFRETRGATEAAGIANAIRADTECFRIFREDNGSVESRKAAKDRFRPGLLFTGSPELVQLKAFYDKASELSHTNRRTFAPHLNVNEGTFSYQDLRQPDIPRLVTNYLLWICRAHLAILEAADVVFKDAEGNLVVEFRKERQNVGERLYRFNDQNEGKDF